MLKNQKLLPEFVFEATAHVEKIEAGLLALEQGNQDAQVINTIFRSAHSLKGTAGFFGLNKIVELAHGMESLLVQLRDGDVKITPKMIDDLLVADDRLKQMLENVENSEQMDISACVASLEQHMGEAVLLSAARSAEPAAKPQPDNTVAGNYDELIKAAIKHGHKFYKLVLNFADKVDGSNQRTEIAGNIKLIGTMLANFNCPADGTKGASEIFLFSTVLDEDLLAMALELSRADNLVLEQIAQAEAVQLLKKQAGAGSLSQPQQAAPSGKQEHVQGTGEEKAARVPKEEERIRVNVTLLDSLVNLSSELVLGRNQLLRLLEQHTDSIAGLSGVLQNIDHITTELQEKVMRTRMQPLANIFDKIPRFVRELAKNVGKKVTLQIEGRGVELDKSIIEGLADPLTHLVRNALDHGIEKPEQRLASGKLETAMLAIKAYHEGGRVIIDISDDGDGINIAKIEQKALSQGLLAKESYNKLDESDLLKLIFLPGFSTAERVSDLSGRGVGLDVAKTNIEKLGGTIELYTTPGQGTTFRLILPLTLAILPSLIVTVAEYTFAVPQFNLQEIVRIRPAGENGRKIETIKGQTVLRLRNKLVPIIDLEAVCGMPARDIAATGIAKVLVLKNAVQVFGLMVDAIHDWEEILVKPVPRYLKDSKGYCGVTILGDGKIAMVLDVDAMAAAAKVANIQEPAGGQLACEEQPVTSNNFEQMELLLFTCAGPELLGLDLTQVARVAEINPAEIEAVGEQEYINFHGQPLQLVRPERYLPVAKANTKQAKRIIIPKQAKYKMAILVEKIQDTISGVMTNKLSDINVRGLKGTAVLNDRIVLVVELEQLFMLAGQA